MRNLIAWIRATVRQHGTKLLGFIQGSIAALGVDVIPPAHLKWYLAATGLLTFWRGFFNSPQQDPPPT